jgi:hypothetical protein
MTVIFCGKIQNMTVIFSYNQKTYVYNYVTQNLRQKTEQGLKQLPSTHPSTHNIIKYAWGLPR